MTGTTVFSVFPCCVLCYAPMLWTDLQTISVETNKKTFWHFLIRGTKYAEFYFSHYYEFELFELYIYI